MPPNIDPYLLDDIPMMPFKRLVILAISSQALMCANGFAQSQRMSSDELLRILQSGGNVIVMRQACSPRVFPEPEAAQVDNTVLDRQLDQTGRITATAMGVALHELNIPISTVYSSPAYRALQTVKLAQLPEAKIYPELSDGGGFVAIASPGQSNWLRYQATHFPKGGNTLIVTHLANIRSAFPEYGGDVADGEALIFGPEGSAGRALLARIKIEDWPKLK